MPVQDREQQAHALRVEALREPTWRLRGARIDERLHLDEHGPGAFARHERHATRHRRAMPREKDRRRILDLAEALLRHNEEAELVRGAEPILCRPHDPKTAADVALEVEHRVYH